MTTMTVNGKDVRKVVIACDAGMGSSALVAATMKKQLAPYDVTVEHTAVNSIPADADVIVCHVGLADRARKIAPDKLVLPFMMFLGDPVFAKVVAAIRDGSDLGD
jgi:mannitol-specific phosphotransferase system IIBC component